MGNMQIWLDRKAGGAHIYRCALKG